MSRLGLLLACGALLAALPADAQQAAAGDAPGPPSPPARDRAAWLADLEAACAGVPSALGCELWEECKV